MALLLGQSRRRKDVSLTAEERSRHVHVIGASGTGKSKLLESMIRQDILAGHGLCLIDPHGTLADEIVRFCASRRVEGAGRVHVIKPSDPEWCFAFNPLRLDGVIDPAVRVDAMVAACAQVWGGENPNSTPLLKKCLRAVFYALAVRGLTLTEATELISSTSQERPKLTADLPDYVFAALWREFNALSRKEFADVFSSTGNRLIEFLSSPTVRRIVGQRERALDLRRAMDESDIVILNLGRQGNLSPDNARLLGTLITSELFLLALGRDEATATQRPFYLYIDECYKFLTDDVAAMFDQTRKFGLHIVLAHQHLSQLGDPNSPIYKGVMAGGQTKIVFGGLEDDDAEVMARQVLRDTFNLERPKHALDKPTVVDEVPFWLESESATDSESSGSSFSENAGWTNSSGTSEGRTLSNRWADGQDLGQVAAAIGTGTSSSTGFSGGMTVSENYAQGTSVSHGRAQTLKPVREVLPTALYSLEEELHLAIVKLRGLPKRSAVVRRPGKTAVRVRAPDILPVLSEHAHVTRFEASAREASGAFSSRGSVDAEISKRQPYLLARAASLQIGEDQFWSEET